MSRLFLCCALLAASQYLEAQIALRGAFSNLPETATRQVAVEYWNMDHWQQAAVANILTDHSFAVSLPTAAPGQYRLRVWNQNKIWSDFIVADSAMADKSLVFALDYDKMDGGPARISGSVANDLYFDLMTAYRQISQSEKPEAAQGDFNSYCLDLATQYRKTLLGDIALLLYEPRKEDYAGKTAIQKMTANEFVKAHALDKVPFGHENCLYHNVFLKRLNSYFNYFDRTEAGSNAYIDGIMAARNGNDAVDGFVFRYLLDKMMDTKNDPSLTYLLKWYTPDCTDENPQPNNIQNLLAALKACAPGNLAPDLNLPNLDGKTVQLSTVCAQHKLTLLLFWRSGCSHCQEFEPKLEEIYKKYHPMGLEVYALSTDKIEQEWRDHLQQHTTPWINVLIPLSQRHDISRSFPAPSTPTLIALDKNQRVVNRVLSRGNLEAYLDDMLAKLK